MSSNSIRGIRRKKSSLSEVKIAVLGAPGVGKTENRYKSEIMVDGEPVIFEILDTCSKEEMPKDDVIQWADGFLLVYSITDRGSFNMVKTLRQYIYDKKQLAKENNVPNGPPLFPIVVVANKSDLIHLRQLSTEEGEILSKDLDFVFTELSAAEHVTQVSDAFYDLCREVHTIRRRTKQSLLDRMLGKNKT